MNGRADILELHVDGDWSWIRNRIDLEVKPPQGESIRRSGYTLTVLQRCADGKWRLARDANLVS